ncbi:grpE protein homolog 2, mitochondrial-like [Primulina huaijiensis]|uniref:grpE protein homolog 2, mitochondrial-like n=1 Tax=Primulina huaijiensis TaxID=1492673 RepID=UPI003CC70069
MSMSRITTRFSRAVLAQFRHPRPLFGRQDTHCVSSFSNLLYPHDEVGRGRISLLHHSALNSSAFQWFGFSSSSSPQVNEETARSGSEVENKTERGDVPDHSDVSVSAEKTESDLENDLSRDDLMKILVEKEQLLVTKQEEIEKMKDKVLRTFAEMENVKDRTKREAENAKKFAIQNFAKSLLDVADNLGRASSAAKESYTKIDASTDTAGAVQQLKILLDGVEMTEKQLTEVFKKFGLEKYDPINEEFDPNRHSAVFQVPDASKPAGHVAVVLKAGYMLHDRVIRPAEVGVTVAMNNE